MFSIVTEPTTMLRSGDVVYYFQELPSVWFRTKRAALQFKAQSGVNGAGISDKPFCAMDGSAA